MNERINLLALQADEYCRDYVPNWNMNDYNKKFTELIVLACSDELIKWKDEPFPYDPEFGARLIKSLFGIK